MNEAVADRRAPTLVKPLAADLYEKILAVASVVLLACVIVAVTRGQPDWPKIPAIVWAHLATIAVALALTPLMLLRRRGDSTHRNLGWVWAGSMILTAFLSLFVRQINNGGFSLIHVLSVWTLIQVPLLVVAARRHQVARHRSAVRGMVTGALLIAGFFTFPFDRLLGDWLFG